MKKTVIIAAIVILLILLVLFVPTQKATFQDGGTKEYRALAYKVVVWNRITTSGIVHKTSVYWYPRNQNSIDMLWDYEQQKSHEKLTGTYVWEKEGFGGDFSITLKKDGTFTYYEGLLSSFFGEGTWIDNDGILILAEHRSERIIDYYFKTDKDALVFIGEGSGSFIFCDVADGDRFIKND